MSAILTQITQSYQQATSGWYQYLFPAAQHLFGMLSIIEIAWSGALWVLNQHETESLWIEFLKKMLKIGFFYTLLLNAQTWMPDVIQSFIKLGAGASHIPELYPSDILDQGISVASSIVEPLLDAGLLHAGIGLFVGGFSALIVAISFALIAAELVAALIESYIVISAGIILLGFSSNRFTDGYSSRYLNYAVSVGVKLFVLYLIIGVGSTIASDWGQLVIQGGSKNMTPFLEVIGGSLVFLYVTRSIPNKAESLLSGAISMSGNGLIGVAAGAALVSSRTSINSAYTGYQAFKQASMVSQFHNHSPLGVIKGIAAAGKSVASSTLGTHMGSHRSMGSAMSQQTRSLDKKIAEKRESQISTNKEGESK